MKKITKVFFIVFLLSLCGCAGTAKSNFKKANAYFEDAEYQHASYYYILTLEEDRGNEAAYYGLIDALIEQKRYDDAQKYTEEAIRKFGSMEALTRQGFLDKLIRLEEKKEKEANATPTPTPKPTVAPTATPVAEKPRELSVEDTKYMLCDKYLLKRENLEFCGMIPANGKEYYGFLVIDYTGNIVEYKLLSDQYAKETYKMNEDGTVERLWAEKFDYLNEFTLYERDEWPKESTYTYDCWEGALDAYLSAMLFDKDREKASALTDNSYYYYPETKITDKMREMYVNDLSAFQENVISSVEKMDDMVASGELDYYMIEYYIDHIDPYQDSFKAGWVDVYFSLQITYSRKGNEEEGGEFYRLSLRHYPEGWRVTWLTES